MRGKYKESFSFRIMRAHLTYGAGPFRSRLRASTRDFKDSLLSTPSIEFELSPDLLELQNHLGPGTAYAEILRSPQRRVVPKSRPPEDGYIFIGPLGGTSTEVPPIIRIVSFLPADVFDSVASTLVLGGTEGLTDTRLEVGVRTKYQVVPDDGQVRLGKYDLEHLSFGLSLHSQQKKPAQGV